MYESHFGFSGPPFQLNPDPEFYFDSAGHSKALSYLRFGVQQGEGFIVITGEVGAGKTTLVRALLRELNPAEVVAAQVANTQLDAFDLLQAILTAFGVRTDGMGKARLIATLEAFLTAVAASGRRALLVVDEAQNLGPQAIEELRMLSNFQLGHHGLLQSFLVGQPELRHQLQTGAMEQLRQRVLASYHLGPLDAEETAAYVQHRLRHVGWKERPRFEPAAFRALYQRTGGIPRRINTLANRVLLAAYLGDAALLGETLVNAAADELQQEIQAPHMRPPMPVAPPTVVKPIAPMPAGRPRVQPAERAEVPRTESAQAVHPESTPAPARRPAAPVERAAAVPVSAPTARAAAPAHIAPAAVLTTPLSAAASAPAAPAPASAVVTLAATPDIELPAAAGSARPGASEGLPRAAVFCVADSPLAWFKLRSLSRRWTLQPDMPPMVLVHPGRRALLQHSWQQQVETGLPVAEHHLGVPPGPVGQTQAAIALRFADLLSEAAPCAVLIGGASYATLTCALIARQMDLPVIRLEGGRCRADSESGLAPLHALLDRSADWLTVDARHDQQLLEAEGFDARQLAVTGSLTAGILDELQPLLPTAAELMADLGLSQEWQARAATGYGLVTAQFMAQDVAPGDALQWLMLARNGNHELPLLWPVSDRTAQVMREPTLQLQLQASGIAVVRGDDYFQRLSLLARARCVIAGPARTLIEEASAWGVPSVVVQLYADAPAASAAALVSCVGPSASQFRAAVRAALQLARPDRGLPSTPVDAVLATVEQIGRWLPQGWASDDSSPLNEVAA